jgi:hypothetical protein
MYQVGTGAGQSWQFNQGQGEATVAKTPLTDNFMSSLALMNEKDKRDEKKADADDFQKRVDLLNKSHQEMDFRAQDATRGVVTSLIDDASAYRAETGKNPFLASNTDPRAREFQMAYQKLATLPQSVGQVSEELKASQKLALTNPDKFTDESIKAFTDPNILDIVKSGKVPQLQHKAPIADALAAIKTGLTQIGAKTIEGATQGAGEIVANMKATDPGAWNAVGQIVNDMSDARKAAVQQFADENGIQDLKEAYIVQTAQLMADPDYTFEGTDQMMFEAGRKLVSTHTNEEGGYAPKRGKSTIQLFKDVAESNPRFVADLVVKGYGKTEKEAVNNWAIEQSKKDLGNTKSNPKDDPTDGDGGGAGASRAKYQEWENLVKSGDPAAEGYLNGEKFATQTKKGEPAEGTVISVKLKPNVQQYSENPTQQPLVLVPKFMVTYIEKKGEEELIVTKEMAKDEFERSFISPVTKVLGSAKDGQSQSQVKHNLQQGRYDE